MKNIAVIGCGYWGKNLIRNFHELGVLTAVCDPVETLARSLSKQYSVPVKSWHEILNDASIRGVVLAVPVPLHATLCCEALEAQKDVFVEKPLALTETEGMRVKKTLQESSQILLVGHLLRYHPAVETIRKLLSDGTIGSLKYIHSNRLNFGQIRANENALWSLAPHDFSVIRHLIQSDITSISAHGQCFFKDKTIDRSDICITYASGVHAEVCVSWIHPFKERKLIVGGTKGMLVFDDTLPQNQKLKLYRHVCTRDKQLIIAEKTDPECISFASDRTFESRMSTFHRLYAIPSATAYRHR